MTEERAVEIKVDIRKDMYRQFVDGDDDDVLWLRLPDDERGALLHLLLQMSLDQMMGFGITREAALKLSNVTHALY